MKLLSTLVIAAFLAGSVAPAFAESAKKVVAKKEVTKKVVKKEVTKKEIKK
jgi:hypothetical protein